MRKLKSTGDAKKSEIIIFIAQQKEKDQIPFFPHVGKFMDFFM